MSQQQVEDALKNLPCTDEAGKRELEWMRSNDESHLDSSELSNRGSCIGDARKVSIMNARIGSDIKGTKQGLIDSQGGRANRKGSTASQDEPANSKKGSTASHGGPKFSDSDDLLPKTGIATPGPQTTRRKSRQSGLSWTLTPTQNRRAHLA